MTYFRSEMKSTLDLSRSRSFCSPLNDKHAFWTPTNVHCTRLIHLIKQSTWYYFHFQSSSLLISSGKQHVKKQSTLHIVSVAVILSNCLTFFFVISYSIFYSFIFINPHKLLNYPLKFCAIFISKIEWFIAVRLMESVFSNYKYAHFVSTKQCI